MGLLSKPPRCQIPAERLTIAFPTLRKVRKEKRKYQSPGLAVCSQINGKRLPPTPPPSTKLTSSGNMTGRGGQLLIAPH